MQSVLRSALGSVLKSAWSSSNRTVKAVIFGASLLLASQAFASGTEQLKAFIAQVHSAHGSFVQREVKAPSKAAASATQGMASRLGGTSSGTFTFARPGKFIWAYDKQIGRASCR